MRSVTASLWYFLAVHNPSWSRRTLVAVVLLGGCTNEPSGGEIVCKTIGTNGDLITSSDGQLSISLRPQSLMEDTEVCIRPTDVEGADAGLPAVYGEAYRVTPNIDLGVTAIVSYRHMLPPDPSTAAIGVILLEDFQAGLGVWRPLPVGRVEIDTQLVTANDSRISMYYGLLDDGPADPTVADNEGPESQGSMEAPDTGPGEDTTGETGNDPSDTNDPTTDPTDPPDETGGPPEICDNLPAGPFTVTPEGDGQVFPQAGAEDIAMLGDGTFVGITGTVIGLFQPPATRSVFSMGFAGNGLGMAFDSDGTLLVAHQPDVNVSQVSRFTLDGQPELVAVLDEPGNNSPNGLYVDSAGDIWVTAFDTGQILHLRSGETAFEFIAMATGGQPNGIFFDEDRNRLYWTEFDGALWAIGIDDGGNAVADSTTLITDLDGRSDGMTLDVCGNAYVVNNAQGMDTPCTVDRIILDAAGDFVRVEPITGSGGEIGSGCSNVDFGYGFGGAGDESLWVSNQDGTVFSVDVGVPGYPIPLPQ